MNKQVLLVSLSDYKGGEITDVYVADSVEDALIVFACVDVIASIMSIIPVSIYESKSDGKYPAPHHDQSYLLKKEPHRMYSSVHFFKTITAYYLLWGDGYARILRDKSTALIAALVWAVAYNALLRHELAQEVIFLQECQARQLQYNQKNIKVMKKIIDLNTSNRHGRNYNRN